MVRQYSKNIASDYNRWLCFVGKAKKLGSEHKLATAPLSVDAELPKWYNPKTEAIKAPDGQEYVIYYADQTEDEHEKEEDSKREKVWDKEFEVAQQWKKVHKDGKFEFNLTGEKNGLNTMQFPFLLGRDSDGNRWYIKYGEAGGDWRSRVYGLYVEKIEKRRKYGSEKPLNEFVSKPEIGQVDAPSSFVEAAKKYVPWNFRTATIDIGSENSAMDPKVGPIKRWSFEGEGREPGLEEKSKKYKDPLIIDWDNPGLENIKKILKSRGLEGKVDEVKFETGARYSLFDLKNKDDD